MPALDFKGKQFVHSHHLSVPFRELLIDAKKSLPAQSAKPSLADNLIIHGDNLEALKALLPTHAGKVDCIFIDPPYNTGNEGWCYNDNVRSPLMKEWLKKSANPVDKEDLERHDKWLCMMWPRLCLLRELLAETGSIWVTLDDNEIHRFRGLMDEIFGEENFVACCIWHKMDSPKNTADQFSEDHDYLLVYAKDGGNRRFILIECEDYADTLTAERVRRVIDGYPFSGTQRTELFTEKLTWTAFKKAADLLEKIESIEQLEGAAYDKVKKEIKDGVLTVTGERKIEEQAPGLGGSFTYCTLGEPIEVESLLTGHGLPAYEALARYVFYTATGQSLAKVAKVAKPRADGFIGETDLFRLHLFYQPAKEWLRSNDAALNAARVESVKNGTQAGKRASVFAVAKFMSQKELTKQRIEFCQLPYAVHRILGD